MQDKSIAECPNGSILQYFQPSLSYHLSLRSWFCIFLSDFTVCSKPPINFHIDIFSRAKGLNFGLNLDLHPYFVYVTVKALTRLQISVG